VGIIEKGILYVNGRVDEVMKQVRQAIILHIRVVSDPERAAKLIEGHGDVATVEVRAPDLIVVTLNKGVLDYSFIPTMLLEGGFKLVLFREEELNLETAFMELTRGLVQ
jgi:ABC-2 type transport system ATP-binding protein